MNGARHARIRSNSGMTRTPTTLGANLSATTFPWGRQWRRWQAKGPAGQDIRFRIAEAGLPGKGDLIEARQQGLRFGDQRSETGHSGALGAEHMTHGKIAVADDVQLARTVLQRQLQAGNEGLHLRFVIAAVARTDGSAGHMLAGRAAQHHAEADAPRVGQRSAIHPQLPEGGILDPAG